MLSSTMLVCNRIFSSSKQEPESFLEEQSFSLYLSWSRIRIEPIFWDYLYEIGQISLFDKESCQNQSFHGVENEISHYQQATEFFDQPFNNCNWILGVEHTVELPVSRYPVGCLSFR